MTWKTKAVIQRILSSFPGGVQVNYALQRYVTRTLPESETIFTDRVQIAQRHIEKLLAHGGGRLEDKLFFEFGAGRDLCGPLVFYSMGVTRQRLVDLQFLLRPFLVNDTLRRLRRDAARFHLPLSPAHFVREDKEGCLEDLRHHYGIDFVAPSDARCTGLADGAVDIITSTNTLEHIPPTDIASILKELRRILAPDGRLSFLVDYQDHWSYFDSNINVYNFLCYSAAEWAPYNPDLNYQNRLRHADYMRLYQQADFGIVDEHTEGAQPTDLEKIAAIPVVASEFAHFDPVAIRLRKGFVVLKAKT